MNIQIIYKNNDFLAINKPAGLLTHPAPTPKIQKEKTLVDFIIKKFPEIKTVGDAPRTRPGIVHRLDKGTSGVILIARNQKYFEYLKNLFQTRQVKKIYWALVWGMVIPKKGIIEKPISLKHGAIKRTVWQGKMSKEAITEYRKITNYQLPIANLKQGHTFSLLEVFPMTGRTHQIRIHLASISHPIVGDALYGPKENPLGLKRQFLHAESIEFPVSEKSKIKIEAELPQDLKDALNQLTALD